MTQGNMWLTGGNARLIVNGVLLAYATDVSYRVVVNHIVPQVCGMYEGQEITPLSYRVNGGFTLIRYARGAADAMRVPPPGVSSRGNGVGSWKPDRGNSAVDVIAGGLGAPIGNNANNGHADTSMVPASLKNGFMFDIEIRQAIAEHVRDDQFNIGQCEWTKLRNCRITSSDFSLGARGVARQKFTFEAIYADEDSFFANRSGVGQDLE